MATEAVVDRRGVFVISDPEGYKTNIRQNMIKFRQTAKAAGVKIN